MLHKGWDYDSILKIPYFRFMMLVDTWAEEIQEETKRREREQDNQRAEEAKIRNQYSMPSVKVPEMKPPSWL